MKIEFKSVGYLSLFWWLTTVNSGLFFYSSAGVEPSIWAYKVEKARSKYSGLLKFIDLLC